VIGLFGGSFDPIHHGHLIVGQLVGEALGLREVRFMPAWEQPLKRGRHGAPAADRLRMVELAVAGAAGLTVEREEVERGGPSYTVETLRALRAREPGERFAVLVGADAARDLPAWHEAEVLPELAELIVFRRGRQTVDEVLGVRAVEVPAIEISASTIRRRVREGRSIRYYVPEVVARYIDDRRLYLSNEG